jgi:spore coat protein A
MKHELEKNSLKVPSEHPGMLTPHEERREKMKSGRPWKTGILTLAGLLFLGSITVAFAAPLPGGTLDPTMIPKFQDNLVIPPAMPKSTSDTSVDYQIAVRQFKQQILPATFPKTTVWSYGSIDDPSTFNYPAFTIETQADQEIKVKWINDLKDPVSGHYLPHLFFVDQTLHWANPNQDCADGTIGTDCRGDNPGPYLGPVPMITHVHGAHTTEESDGYPEAWYLPDATNIPPTYATHGSHFGQISGAPDTPGQTIFHYPNDQRATTLWYHDHTLGMTRLNVYAGPAGFYLLRGGVGDVVDDNRTDPAGDGVLPGPAPQLGDSAGTKYYEIPIVIQGRSFNIDGSLFYPKNRLFFDGYAGPYIPHSDISRIWNPEFFGNTMVVNGKTLPKIQFEQRRYRFRFLNGCDSRFLVLDAPLPSPLEGNITFSQIGSDGGFLPSVVNQTQLLLGPAERADVIVDFTNIPVGTKITLLNLAPDEPFGGGEPGNGDFDSADPGTTGQVMQFEVVAIDGTDNSTPPANLVLPAPVDLGTPVPTPRKISLNEEVSATVCLNSQGRPVPCSAHSATEGGEAGPIAALLGTLDSSGNPVPKLWMDAITETPTLGTTEVWEIYNFTADAHPIHIHLVQFEILNRQALETDEEGIATAPATLVGSPRPPEAWETGRKDTVIVYPGEVARVKAYFDNPGIFVWHCHILEHEDNEMMRPYRVVPPSI